MGELIVDLGFASKEACNRWWYDKELGVGEEEEVEVTWEYEIGEGAWIEHWGGSKDLWVFEEIGNYSWGEVI